MRRLPAERAQMRNDFAFAITMGLAGRKSYLDKALVDPEQGGGFASRVFDLAEIMTKEAEAREDSDVALLEAELREKAKART